jgi:hypothetical protein
MAINQLSTANTFEQWLIATQLLIEKSNYYEDESNLILDFANTVSNIYPVFLNTSNQVFETANNVFDTANDVFSYVGTSFDVANTVLEISLEAFDHANAGYTHANSAFDHANGAYDLANATYEESNSAYEHANSAYTHANSAYLTANGAFDKSNSAYAVANSLLPYLANNSNLAVITEETTTDNDAFYVLFTQDESLLIEGYIAKNKLYYNPATGTIAAVSARFTGNSHITIPVGSELERPANAVPGMFRYNNEANTFEGHRGTKQSGVLGK